MGRLTSVVGLLRALARVSVRETQSFRSLAGQNFLLFLILVGLQPASAYFFLLILAVILLFPLSSDPMQKIPPERRLTWPLLDREWTVVRVCSLALSPIAWLAILLLWRAGWRLAILTAAAGLMVQVLAHLGKRIAAKLPSGMFHRLPALPGVTGAIMRLQWREMLRTLDLYLALLLAAITVAYRFTGRPLDPDAPRIMALVVVAALSTQTQVLLGIDGHGAERYRQIPIRGWQILLAKNLAFLVLLALLVAPLDFVSGVMGGIAALATGQHRSVTSPIPQTPWRFTAGALVPDGVIQMIALFAVGNEARSVGWLLVVPCIAAWAASLFIYGWIWDRRAG